MDQVCRLCLTRSLEFTELSEDSEIHRKIQRCLNMHITLETWLPKAVCTVCINKIEYIQEYLNFVSNNQEVLKCSLNQNLKAPNELNMHMDGLSKNSTPKFDTEMIMVKHETPTNNDGIKVEYDFDASFDSDETSRGSDTKPESVKETAAVKSQVDIEQNENEEKEKVVQNNIEMKLFKCLTCFVMFEKQIELVKHYTQEHYKIQGNHVINNFVREKINGTLTYRCKECNKVCESKKIINRHMITHSEDRPFVCKLCGRAYKTAWHIVYHGRVHREYKMTCSYKCGFSTVYQGALTQHEKLHRTEFKFKCQECGKGFQVRTCYEQHQNIHNGVRPFKCDICGSAFHVDSYLQAHRAKVHPQTSNIKRYVCVHCSLRCDSKNSLTLHLKEHGIKTSFLCDTCGKTLSSAVQLKLHKTLHLGVKPFSCSTCNKSFAKKSNLTLHLQTHARSRSYACACGKKYSRHAALRRHCLQARHVPESVNCPKCDKSFPSQYQLATHKKMCT